MRNGESGRVAILLEKADVGGIERLISLLEKSNVGKIERFAEILT